jgi:hypothetical protein
MTTYNWNISQTNYENANGFIITAHWQCTAVDGGVHSVYLLNILMASWYANHSLRRSHNG